MDKIELPKHTLMGASIMPSELMDRIGKHWDDNKEKANKGLSGDMYTKESMDIHIEVDDFSEPWGDYRRYLQLCLEDYFKKYPEADTMQQGIVEPINIQKYAPGGGYYQYHTERGSADGIQSSRHLVFMTYLNNVSDCGETMFFHQDTQIHPEKGKTIIWPADWTHTHKGKLQRNMRKELLQGGIVMMKCLKHHMKYLIKLRTR